MGGGGGEETRLSLSVSSEQKSAPFAVSVSVTSEQKGAPSVTSELKGSPVAVCNV